jgi:hypothetical protein
MNIQNEEAIPLSKCCRAPMILEYRHGHYVMICSQCLNINHNNKLACACELEIKGWDKMSPCLIDQRV